MADPVLKGSDAEIMVHAGIAAPDTVIALSASLGRVVVKPVPFHLVARVPIPALALSDCTVNRSSILIDRIALLSRVSLLAIARLTLEPFRIASASYTFQANGIRHIVNGIASRSAGFRRCCHSTKISDNCFYTVNPFPKCRVSCCARHCKTKRGGILNVIRLCCDRSDSIPMPGTGARRNFRHIKNRCRHCRNASSIHRERCNRVIGNDHATLREQPSSTLHIYISFLQGLGLGVTTLNQDSNASNSADIHIIDWKKGKGAFIDRTAPLSGFCEYGVSSRAALSF